MAITITDNDQDGGIWGNVVDLAQDILHPSQRHPANHGPPFAHVAMLLAVALQPHGSCHAPMLRVQHAELVLGWMATISRVRIIGDMQWPTSARRKTARDVGVILYILTWFDENLMRSGERVWMC